ncbi:MAG: hypothetical protein NC131_18360 [Roseburia sp.]|nr:hypothetical protein [Roseburia sp.]
MCGIVRMAKMEEGAARREEILPGFPYAWKGDGADAEEAEAPVRISGMPGADGWQVLWGTCGCHGEAV